MALIDGARVFVVEPPSIPGYGTGGGFEFQLLDQSSGVYSLNEFLVPRSRSCTAKCQPDLNQRLFAVLSPGSAVQDRCGP